MFCRNFCTIILNCIGEWRTLNCIMKLHGDALSSASAPAARFVRRLFEMLSDCSVSAASTSRWKASAAKRSVSLCSFASMSSRSFSAVKARSPDRRNCWAFVSKCLSVVNT